MLVPLLALAMLHQSTEIQAVQKGSWLYSACKGAQRYLDAPTGHKPEEDSSNFDNCTSYIAGFIEGDNGIASCPPDEASLGTMLRLYLAYMDKNPKLLDNYRVLGLRTALREAYPCRQK